MNFTDIIFFDTNFILSETLQWAELQYGYKKAWIGYKIIVEYAIKKLAEQYDDDIALLAGIDKNNISDIDLLTNKLQEKEGFLPKDFIKMKWLYLSMKWISENCELNEIKDKVNLIYTFFDYSEDVKEFSDWMSYNEGVILTEENIKELLFEYLAKMKKFFNCIKNRF